MLQVLAALEVAELGQGERARSTAWAAAPVMVKRKLLSASEMDRGS